MKEFEFLKFVIESLVQNKESIVIDSKEDELGVLLTLTVHKDDMWIIIWKSWNTINSIRNILRIFWMKSWKRVNLKVLG